MNRLALLAERLRLAAEIWLQRHGPWWLLLAVLGCVLLGLAIGDALGNTSESLPVPERAARYGEIRDYPTNCRSAGRRVGLPSDDSQLAFWTLESLLECRGLDPDDLSARFAAREIFGIGKSMQQFLHNREQGMASWYHYGAESAGNGALMRIAPPVSYTHLRAHETVLDLVCRLLLEKKK